MTIFKKNTMALPTPNPNNFDYTKIAEFIATLIAIFGAYLAGINVWFKNKEKERQAKDRERESFIQAITDKAVDFKLTTYKTEFAEYKAEFHVFKTNMETQMNRFNTTVLDILDEVKK